MIPAICPFIIKTGKLEERIVKKKKKFDFTLWLIVLVFVAGLGFMIYPTFSSVWNSYHQSRAIVAYSDDVKNLSDETRERIYTDALYYNLALYEDPDRWHFSEEEQVWYEGSLQVSASEVMGYLEIDKIDVSLPIYHGTDESVLQSGIGHLQGTSLPTGGVNTHTVLSGHRGLPSSTLLTNLDQMEVGDQFNIHVMDHILTYEVDQIVTVLPEEMDNLQIVSGEDYATLVTCTPYGINTHRLLVRGKRIQTPTEKEVIEPMIDKTLYYWIAGAAGICIASILILLAVHGIRKKKARNKGQKRKKDLKDEEME